MVAWNDPKAIRLMNSLSMGNLSTKTFTTRFIKLSLHNFLVVGSSIVNIAKTKTKSQEEEIMIP